MKRGKPMRRTPLPRRSSTLAPKKPMNRGKRRPKTPDLGERPDPDGIFWHGLRKQLYARSGWRCEMGGEDLHVTGMEAHHRKLRSQGGPDTIENLAALCPDCHQHGPDAVHRQVAAARARGFIVPSQLDPATWAVQLHDGRTVRFTADGGYDLCFPAPSTAEENPDGTEDTA